jgi:hypothetical protein
MPTGGTDGTGSLGVRGLRAASRPHRDCNLIYCVYVRSDDSFITEIEGFSFLLDILRPGKQNGGAYPQEWSNPFEGDSRTFSS